MQFRVVPLTGDGNPGAIPTAFRRGHPCRRPRRSGICCCASSRPPGQISRATCSSGTVAQGPLFWTDPTTEVIKVNDTEMWRVANTTDDAHPIHIHSIDFKVVDRIPFDADALKAAQDAFAAGTGPGPRSTTTSPAPRFPSEAGLGPRTLS